MTAHCGQCRPYTGMSPCVPRSLRDECRSCARHSPHLPADPTDRPATVLVDASTVSPAYSLCPLWFPSMPQNAKTDPRRMTARNLAYRENRKRRLLAKAATKSGWSVKDFGGASESFSADAARMLADGRLFRAPSNGGYRYFTTLTLVKEFEEAKRTAPRGRPAGAGTRQCAGFGVDDKAYTPPGVEIQRAPTPRGRYEVDGPIVGGFVSDWQTKRGSHSQA